MRVVVAGLFPWGSAHTLTRVCILPSTPSGPPLVVGGLWRAHSSHPRGTSGTPWPAALLTLPGASRIPVLAATPHTSSESVPPVPKDSGGPDSHPACLSHLAQQSAHRLVGVMGGGTPRRSPTQMPVLCRQDANPAGQEQVTVTHEKRT